MELTKLIVRVRDVSRPKSGKFLVPSYLNIRKGLGKDLDYDRVRIENLAGKFREFDYEGYEYAGRKTFLHLGDLKLKS